MSEIGQGPVRSVKRGILLSKTVSYLLARTLILLPDGVDGAARMLGSIDGCHHSAAGVGGFVRYGMFNEFILFCLLLLSLLIQIDVLDYDSEWSKHGRSTLKTCVSRQSRAEWSSEGGTESVQHDELAAER